VNPARVHIIIVVLLAWGCSVDSGAIAPPPDGGPVSDSAVSDSAVVRDSSTPDAADSTVPPVDGGCTPAMDGCAMGVATICNRATGAFEMVSCPLGCSPTAGRCAEIVPSNVDPVFLDPGAAEMTWEDGTRIDTTVCDLGTVATQMGGGPEACVLSLGAVTVTGDARVVGSRPLIIVASGAVEISGELDASAYARTPGPGGGIGGTRSTPTGGGPSPGVRGTNEATYGDGGGGGGGLCGSGGSGGDGGSGAVGGAGGAAIAPDELSPLVGGSGGGLGFGSEGSEADGGGGGGALQITSAVSIRISGAIRAGGGGGGQGGGAPVVGNWAAGGGGGSGGAVLLEAPTIEGPGGTGIFASGGGGGAAGHNAGDGGSGVNGANRTGRASGGASMGGGAGAGGDSGGGDQLDGLPGGSNSDYLGSNGGGGGGGAGCILLRTADGAVPASLMDSSPSVAPGLRAMAVGVR
jgi:hypothetical protein